MNIVKYAAVSLGALILGVVVGTSTGTEPEPTPTPEPAPSVALMPTPTPRTVTETVEVEVVPSVCIDALYAADEVISESSVLALDILGAYVDYPDEDLIQFGRRVEDIIAATDPDTLDETFDEYATLADACLAY